MCKGLLDRYLHSQIVTGANLQTCQFEYMAQYYKIHSQLVRQVPALYQKNTQCMYSEPELVRPQLVTHHHGIRVHSSSALSNITYICHMWFVFSLSSSPSERKLHAQCNFGFSRADHRHVGQLYIQLHSSLFKNKL